MLEAVQKIVRQGNSAMVTIPRQVLRALDVRPGDFVQLIEQAPGVFLLRSWANKENAARLSPGVLNERLPLERRG